MNWLLFVLLSINIVYGNVCDVKRKGIITSLPVIPENIVTEANWPLQFKSSFLELCKNLKIPDSFHRGYRTLTKSDVVFAAQIWRHWDLAIAEKLVQDALVLPINLKHPYSPLLPWGVLRIYEKSGNKDFLVSVYPKLKLIHDAILKKHSHKEGIYISKNEIAEVDLNSFIALSTNSLGKIAAILDLPREEKELEQQYTQLKTIINQKLWDPNRGAYYSWNFRKKNFVYVDSAANVTPMIAGIPDLHQAKLMMDRILDPAYYNGEIPFTTLSRNDSLDLAYLGVLGVDRYTHHRKAKYLARKIIRGAYKKRKKDFGIASVLLLEFGEASPVPFPSGTSKTLAPELTKLY